MKKTRTFGYARVSSKEQNEARQMEALVAYKIAKRNIFVDKKSGKDFERPAWQCLLQKIRENDLLVVKSIDRLGRNYDEILEQWQVLTKDIKANILILDMPLLDTRSKGKDLTGTFISDLVLQLLSYVAQTERENIRQRQSEGIACAIANGTHFGRSERDIPEFRDIIRMWRNNDITATEAAIRCGMTRQGFYKRAKKVPLTDSWDETEAS